MSSFKRDERLVITCTRKEFMEFKRLAELEQKSFSQYARDLLSKLVEFRNIQEDAGAVG